MNSIEPEQLFENLDSLYDETLENNSHKKGNSHLKLMFSETTCYALAGVRSFVGLFYVKDNNVLLVIENDVSIFFFTL